MNLNTNTSFSLGVNTTFPQSQFCSPLQPVIPPTPIFNFSYANSCPLPLPQLQTALPPPAQLPQTPSFSLVSGTAKEFVKGQLPPVLKTVGLIASAALTADKLVTSIDNSIENGQSKEEAYTCQTAKVISEELAGKTAKGFIVAGIPRYLTAAAANPVIALSVPFVLPQIPAAYQGAQILSQKVGEFTESTCYDAFALARKISNQGD